MAPPSPDSPDRSRLIHHDPAAIVRARTTQGISQRQLAKSLGFYASHMSEIENGKRNATQETLLRISRILRVPVASLKPGYVAKRRPAA